MESEDIKCITLHISYTFAIEWMVKQEATSMRKLWHLATIEMSIQMQKKRKEKTIPPNDNNGT